MIILLEAKLHNNLKTYFTKAIEIVVMPAFPADAIGR